MATETQPGSRGRIIFFVLLILIGGIALFAFNGTGPMGIEERFSTALGIQEDEHDHEEGSGFALEGDPMLYALILILICVACWAVYRKFGM
jgi:hypothetical protein